MAAYQEFDTTEKKMIEVSCLSTPPSYKYTHFIVHALVHILQEEQRQIELQNKVKAQKTLIQQQRDAVQQAKGITQIS